MTAGPGEDETERGKTGGIGIAYVVRVLSLSIQGTQVRTWWILVKYVVLSQNWRLPGKKGERRNKGRREEGSFFIPEL